VQAYTLTVYLNGVAINHARWAGDVRVRECRHCDEHGKGG